mmetsp:Transcript_121142/g.368342  ORF Transcript_121142/g.368342 Transcript_121142/m.368342 type:complete len:353 (+) Transcript_121142:304-1362(+)
MVCSCAHRRPCQPRRYQSRGRGWDLHPYHTRQGLEAPCLLQRLPPPRGQGLLVGRQELQAAGLPLPLVGLPPGRLPEVHAAGRHAQGAQGGARPHARARAGGLRWHHLPEPAARPGPLQRDAWGPAAEARALRPRRRGGRGGEGLRGQGRLEARRRELRGLLPDRRRAPGAVQVLARGRPQVLPGPWSVCWLCHGAAHGHRRPRRLLQLQRLPAPVPGRGHGRPPLPGLPQPQHHDIPALRLHADVLPWPGAGPDARAHDSPHGPHGAQSGGQLGPLRGEVREAPALCDQGQRRGRLRHREPAARPRECPQPGRPGRVPAEVRLAHPPLPEHGDQQPPGCAARRQPHASALQ